MKCEKCGRIERAVERLNTKWVRFTVNNMAGKTLYELPMCASCAEKMIGEIYGRTGPTDQAAKRPEDA